MPTNEQIESCTAIKENIKNFTRINGTNPSFINVNNVGNQTITAMELNDELLKKQDYQDVVAINIEKNQAFSSEFSTEYLMCLSDFHISCQSFTTDFQTFFKKVDLESLEIFKTTLFKKYRWIGTKELVPSDVVSPESFYTQKAYTLPNVKAVICENIDDNKYITTILNEQNHSTKKELYNIEQKLFDHYFDINFVFSVRIFSSSREFDNITRGKDILYFAQ